MRKGLSEITRDEWIKYHWLDDTQLGDEERMMVRHYQRTPDEAAQAMEDWDSTEQERNAE